jgi:hypothetical protein
MALDLVSIPKTLKQVSDVIIKDSSTDIKTLVIS